MSEPQPINPGPPDRELFLAVLEMPAAEREAFLAAQCGNDVARRERVAALLAEHQTESSFLDSPALARSGGGTKVVATTLTQHDIPLGERIGRYKLLQQIGEGGCGVVYMAEQEEPVRRRVALKIIKLGMDTKGVIARFEAERQALAMMDHPNIAKVLDAGATETGRPYFVMELVRGIKITDYADQSNLATDERLKLFIQVCNAIQHAHQKGIIHRDIKPSNILVTLHDGVPVPKVIDFGIAKAIEQKLTDKTLFTQFQAFIGTPAYMSPEQAEMSGLDIDTRSDIYSLGVLLYEILTGETPFDPQALISKGIDECRRTIREQEPARPSNRLATMLAADLTTTAQHRRIEAARLIHLLQGDLDWIVMKCIEKDRSRRYDTATGLAGDVQRYLNNEAVLARPPSNVYRLRKFLRKHRRAVAAAASIAATLVVGAGVSIWLAVWALRAEHAAVALRDQEIAARQRAEEQRERAELGEAAARLNVYVTDINLAQQSLRDGNFGKAVQLLERQLPGSGKPDLRGFEWRYLWELSKGATHEALPTQESSVTSLAANSDGRWLAVGVRDQVQIWSLADRTLVTTLVPREGSVIGGPGPSPGSRGGRMPGPLFASFGSLDFVENGAGLIAGNRWSVRRWRVRDWSEEPPISQATSPIIVSDAGGQVAMGGRFSREGPGAVSVYDGKDLSVVRQLPGTQTPLAISSDGRRLAVGTTNGIAVVNLSEQAEPVLLNGSTNLFGSGVSGFISDRVATFASQDRYLIAPHNAASEGRGVFVLGIWDAATGEELGTMPESPEQIEHTGVISTIALASDGQTLATASMDHSIRLWDLRTRKLITTLQGHLNEIWALEFLPDGETLVSGAKDGSINLWPIRKEPPPNVIPFATQPLAFAADGATLAALAQDGAVVFINLATGDIAQRIATDNVTLRMPFMPGQDRSSHIRLSADLRTMVQRQSGGWVKIWNTETGATNLLKVAGRPVPLLALSPDGRHLVTASHEEMPRWWDLRAGTNMLWSVEIEDAVFSPDGRLIATEGRGGFIQIWSANDRALLAELELPEPQNPRDIVFSPDGSRLATTYPDHTIGLWDTRGGKFLGFFTGHKQPASSVAFSSDGTTLASAGADSTLRLWNVATRQELLVNRRLGANWRDLLFSPSGALLVGGGSGPDVNGLRFFKAPFVDDSEVLSRTARQAVSTH